MSVFSASNADIGFQSTACEDSFPTWSSFYLPIDHGKTAVLANNFAQEAFLGKMALLAETEETGRCNSLQRGSTITRRHNLAEKSTSHNHQQQRFGVNEVLVVLEVIDFVAHAAPQRGCVSPVKSA